MSASQVLWINQNWSGGAFNNPSDGPYLPPGSRPPGYRYAGQYWDRWQGDGEIHNPPPVLEWVWVPNEDLPLENYLIPDQICIFENAEVRGGKLVAQFQDDDLDPQISALVFSLTNGPYTHEPVESWSGHPGLTKPGGTWNWGLPPVVVSPRAVCFAEFELTLSSAYLIESVVPGSYNYTSYGAVVGLYYAFDSSVLLIFQEDGPDQWDLSISYYKCMPAPDYYDWIDELSIKKFHSSDFGIPHVWRLEWQSATHAIDTQTWNPWDVSSDGYLALFIDGVEVWSDRNAPFVLEPTGDSHWDIQNTTGFSQLALGYYGFVGDYGYVKAGYLQDWINIANFINVSINSSLFIGGVARVLGELWTGVPSGVVKARLYCVSDDISCGESAEITGDTPITADFPVILTTGVKIYRLQVMGTPGVDLFFRGAGLKP